MDADGGRRLAPTGVSAPRPSSINHHTHTRTHMHTRVYKNVHLHGWTRTPVKVQMFWKPSSWIPQDFEPEVLAVRWGDTGQKGKLGKCYGRMCIFVPDMRHHFFPPILGQKLAFCLWALEAAVNRGNTPARHRGPGDGSHVATHQWYHPPWQLVPHSPPRHAPLKA